MPRKLLTVEQFESRETKRHKGKYLYYHDYHDMKTKIRIFCIACQKDFYQTPGHHSNGQDCPSCAFLIMAKNQSLTYQEFEERATKRHGGKYIYHHDYVNNKKKIKITCLKCGETFYQTPDNHLNGKGCPYCSGKKQLTWQEFEERVTKLHNGKYQYHHDFISSKKKIKITCLDCGETFYQIPANHSKGHGCPNCSFGKNEKLTGEYLREFFPDNIDESIFHNKTVIDLSSGNKAEIDFKFQVNGQVIFVEYNGGQHYGPVDFFGGKEKFEQYQVPSDVALRKYCKKNNILLFEIDGRKYQNEKIRQYIIDEFLPHIKS